MKLTEHLENHLNEICQGWKDKYAENSVRVVSFENQPHIDIKTYCTLGLSDHVLATAETSPIRQELIFMAYKNFDGAANIASFLSTFAASIIRSHRPLLRGDVVGPSSPIIFNSPLNSIFSAVPMILRHSFFVFEYTIPKTIFPWIIPITKKKLSILEQTVGANLKNS